MWLIGWQKRAVLCGEYGGKREQFCVVNTVVKKGVVLCG